MTSGKLGIPSSAGNALARLLADPADARDLERRSGLSRPTLRKIASTGSADSYVSALSLERATEGFIPAAALVSATTKGADFYSRQPARSLLERAMSEGTTLARYLAHFDLSVGEIWTFMNLPNGRSEKTKEKVRAVLRQLDLSCEGERA